MKTKGKKAAEASNPFDAAMLPWEQFYRCLRCLRPV